MASDTNEHQDDKLMSEFGQFVLNEMTQEMIDQILWVLKEQRLDFIPSLKMQYFLKFAAVQFICFRLKVFVPHFIGCCTQII